MKPDFVVSRATSKTFKTLCLYSQGHLTFMENPIIRITAKFQFKIPHYGLSLSWTLSHGLEVVCMERVVLSYEDLEVGRSPLM